MPAYHRWCGAILQGVGNLPEATPPKKNCPSSLPPSLFTYIYPYFSLNLNRITLYNTFLIVLVLSVLLHVHVGCVCVWLYLYVYFCS